MLVTAGSKVLAKGRVGEIIAHEPAQPEKAYKVRFQDGTEDWFEECDVIVSREEALVEAADEDSRTTLLVRDILSKSQVDFNAWYIDQVRQMCTQEADVKNLASFQLITDILIADGCTSGSPKLKNTFLQKVVQIPQEGIAEMLSTVLHTPNQNRRSNISTFIGQQAKVFANCFEGNFIADDVHYSIAVTLMIVCRVCGVFLNLAVADRTALFALSVLVGEDIPVGFPRGLTGLVTNRQAFIEKVSGACFGFVDFVGRMLHLLGPTMYKRLIVFCVCECLAGCTWEFFSSRPTSSLAGWMHNNGLILGSFILCSHAFVSRLISYYAQFRELESDLPRTRSLTRDWFESTNPDTFVVGALFVLTVICGLEELFMLFTLTLFCFESCFSFVLVIALGIVHLSPMMCSIIAVRRSRRGAQRTGWFTTAMPNMSDGHVRENSPYVIVGGAMALFWWNIFATLMLSILPACALVPLSVFCGYRARAEIVKRNRRHGEHQRSLSLDQVGENSDVEVLGEFIQQQQEVGDLENVDAAAQWQALVSDVLARSPADFEVWCAQQVRQLCIPGVDIEALPSFKIVATMLDRRDDRIAYLQKLTKLSPSTLAKSLGVVQQALRVDTQIFCGKAWRFVDEQAKMFKFGSGEVALNVYFSIATMKLCCRFCSVVCVNWNDRALLINALKYYHERERGCREIRHDEIQSGKILESIFWFSDFLYQMFLLLQPTPFKIVVLVSLAEFVLGWWLWPTYAVLDGSFLWIDGLFLGTFALSARTSIDSWSELYVEFDGLMAGSLRSQPEIARWVENRSVRVSLAVGLSLLAAFCGCEQLLWTWFNSFSLMHSFSIHGNIFEFGCVFACTLLHFLILSPFLTLIWDLAWWRGSFNAHALASCFVVAPFFSTIIGVFVWVDGPLLTFVALASYCGAFCVLRLLRLQGPPPEQLRERPLGMSSGGALLGPLLGPFFEERLREEAVGQDHVNGAAAAVSQSHLVDSLRQPLLVAPSDAAIDRPELEAYPSVPTQSMVCAEHQGESAIQIGDGRRSSVGDRILRGVVVGCLISIIGVIAVLVLGYST